MHDPAADFDLGTMYSIGDHAHDFAKAAAWLRKSVAGGYVPAIQSLALLLENHPELARSSHEAVSLFEEHPDMDNGDRPRHWGLSIVTEC